MICLLKRDGDTQLIAFAIAANSAVYWFCSVRAPKVVDKVMGCLSSMPGMPQIAIPIPTIPDLQDELVAMHIPPKLLAISTALPISGSIVIRMCSSQGAVTNS